MSYEEILKLERKLLEAKEDFYRRQRYLSDFLKVGDTVFIEGGYNEFYGNEVLSINIERAEVTVFEWSIKKITTVCDFYVRVQGGNTQSLSSVINRIYN